MALTDQFNERLEHIFARLTAADVLLLSQLLERPWQTARRRQAMRAEALEAAATLLPEAPPTRTAKLLARCLARYAEGDWARGTAPHDPLTAALHHVMQISRGVVGWHTIYDELQKSRLVLATEPSERWDHADPQDDPAARTAGAPGRNAAHARAD